MPQPFFQTKLFWNVLLATWGLFASAGWFWVMQYSLTGTVTVGLDVPTRWPEGSTLEKNPTGPTILMFVHPRCPCSIASLRELERVQAAASSLKDRQPKWLIIAAVPSNADSKWRESRLLSQAKVLPNTEVVWDLAGVEAQRYKAITSGDVRFYNEHGQLLFSGGITTSRGHEGASKGGDQLIALLCGGNRSMVTTAPVFGCQLYQISDVAPNQSLKAHEVASKHEEGLNP
ncbi:MAG: hypothetical protein JNK90_24870 [Planctomycetaceae bacterium]|nr:hypothetical protein [Planctomycetaceae bacterium]